MKQIKLVALMILGSLLSAPAFAADSRYVAGEHYEITAAKTKTEPMVEEFFNYACAGCYQMEQFSRQFKEKNSGVKFKYVPVELRPAWKIYSEAYFIGVKLGVIEKSHPKLFDRLHVKKKYFKGHDDMKAFFLELGVDEAKYDKTVKSQWLKIQLRQAKQYAFKHKVTGTPSYLVNKRVKLNRNAFNGFGELETAINSFAKE